MKKNKSGTKTLLWSVIMSSPGPLIVGLSLLRGRSSTQIADFVRRTAEFLSIVASYIVYKRTQKDGVCTAEQKRTMEHRTNIFVGCMMCLAGLVMLAVALTNGNADKGNVIPGLVIALLSASANSIFWQKYARLNKSEPNSILAVQARLYRAKTLVDASVSVALTAVLLLPGSRAAYWIDLIGSLGVAAYMIWCGAKNIYEERACRK